MAEKTLLKIGMCGAGGTGKTTLANLLTDKISEKFYPSIVRKVMQDRGVTEAMANQMTPAAMAYLQTCIFEAKVKQDKENPVGLFDRTLIDQLTYLSLRCYSTLTQSVYDAFKSTAFINAQSYDIIFIFPIYSWVGKQDDNFRQEGIFRREIWETVASHYIEESRANIHIMKDVDPVLRMEAALKIIDYHRTLKKERLANLASHTYTQS